MRVLSVSAVVQGGARFVADVVEAAVLLRVVEVARWKEGPSQLVSRLRDRGMKSGARSQGNRRRLARVVNGLDRLIHREPNCYRRSLVRIALDRDAASEPFVLGLDLAATGPTGHAWVERAGEAAREWDVEFRI